MAQDQSVETVVVTGSRIPQQGLYASSPVTAVGAEEMKFEGTTKVENLLNNLPGVFADFGSTDSNGSTGQATVDLRGLGSQRTLVLVNGTRLMPGDPSNPVADLNNIPAALVDHVEVLTGGASAVYGSDAEAGVVNFIMRKDFEGVELDGTWSVFNAGNGNSTLEALQNVYNFANAPRDWWGGQSGDATLLVGSNTADGKGNITAYLSYRNVQPVLQSKRDFSACSISVVKHKNLHKCAGSANKNLWVSLDAYYAYYGGDPTANYLLYQQGNGADGNFGTVGGGFFVPFTGGGDQRYNYGAKNYIQRPDERYTGGFFGHYEVSKAFDVYSSMMFADDHTLAQIAPSGAFLGNYFTMNCDNPLMTASERHDLCGHNAQAFLGNPCVQVGDTGNCNITAGLADVAIGRRDIEGGNRVADLRHTAYRMQVGVKGDLGDGWAYDIYGQYGLTIYAQTYDNELSKARVRNALNVHLVGGVPTCDVAASGQDPTCVPLDYFNGIGSVTPAMLNYIKAQGFMQGSTEEQILSGQLTGDLGQWGIQSPWAKSPVALAIGAEYRAEYLELRTSRDFQINDLYGQGGATLPVPKSGFNVAEGFGEIRIPVVQDMPLAEDFSINAGLRYSSYSTAGAVTSYKVGAEWQPIDDFRVRGSYNRAVRAPNVLELYNPLNVALFGGNDPCAGATGVVATNCLANPVISARVPSLGGLLSCPASQCNAQYGGNLSLKPETSDTKSFGVVFTPTFIDGFTATIDYFDIKIDNYMSFVDPNVTLAACYGAAATAASQAVACPQVFRDPATHSLHTTTGFVGATVINSGFVKTDGVDFEANYTTGLADWGVDGAGSLSANFKGTMLSSLVSEPISGYVSYDCAGLYGLTCGTPSPKWRHQLRLTWSTPWDVDFSINWRHLSSVKLDSNPANTGNNLLLAGQCGTNGSPCPNMIDNDLGSFDYIDLSTSWQVRDGVQLRAGVNNVFDKSPPVVDSNTMGLSQPPFGNGNTFPGVYDSLGRMLFVGATIKY